jgi:DUF971 family protein
MGRPVDPAVVRDTPRLGLTLDSVDQVGSYALSFHWGDGHSTGIYTWQLLRDACPCPECLPTAPEP